MKIQHFKKIFIIIFFSINLVCQGQYKRSLPPSPNAASLGVFGQIDVNGFNGLPNIEIPIYEINTKGFKFPIKIMYHASGVKPDIRAGWLGQNWSLNCNMSITRIMNGREDEITKPTNDYPGPGHELGISYLSNYDVLDRTDWATSSALFSYYNNFMLIGGSPNLNKRPEPEPDEFSFSFLGYSGSFFLNDKGIWVFKCENDGGLRVLSFDVGEFNIPFVSPNNPYSNEVLKKSMIKSFILIDGAGTKYYFGGDINTIEFSRGALIPQTETDQYLNKIVANSWYLTKVETANNNRLDFEYLKSDYFQIQNSESWEKRKIAYPNTGISTNGPGFTPSSVLINPIYLNKIKFKEGSLSFAKSFANDLLPVYPVLNDNLEIFWGHADFIQNSFAPPSTPKYYKLESITLEDLNGNIIDKTEFSYLENNTKRLFLKEVRLNSNVSITKKYLLDYYDDPSPTKRMPNYVQRELDHWGFWNGRNWFRDMLPVTSYNTLIHAPLYTTHREPVFDCTLSGTLKNITYPTGGKSVFKYELNDYNGLMNYYGSNYSNTFNVNNPISFEILNSLPKTAGGLRIKEIENFDNTTSISNIKTFEYKNNSTQSSGILNGLPRYFELGTIPTNWGPLSYEIWRNYAVQPFGSSKGSHISYSKVKEKLLDGSYVSRSYSNQENLAFRDKPLVAMTPTYLYDNGIPYNDLSLSRGLLLKEEYYNNNNVLLKRVEFEYNNDPNKYDKYVKLAKINFNFLRNSTEEMTEFKGLSGTTLIINSFDASSVFAYKKFIYSEKVSKIMETNFDINSQNSSTNTKEILYNIDGNIKEEITINSLGKKRRKFFKYNKDYNISSGIQGAASFGLVYLSTKEVNNAVVETFTVESDISGANPIVIEGVINIYNSNIAEIDKTLRLDIKTPIPYNASFESFINTSTGLFQYNQNYKDIGEIVLYDNIGNILESKMRNEEPQSYIYDYNKSYLSASVTNSSSGNVAATSFEADGNGNFNIGSPSRENTTSITGKKHYNLANGNISKTGLNSTSTFIVSYWTKNNSAFTIPGTQPGFPISGRVLNGWTYYEHKINGQTTITISGNGAIDELRLYPEKAFMTTYTYEPLIGLKSQCDVNNRITYYEYDAFNRLLLIRDQDYNILKKICYNYAGQVQDCPLLVNAAAIWSVTGKSRCQKCPIDNNYLSGLQEIQEIDTNPNSETYNTIRWILNPIPPLLPKTCRSKPDWQTTTVCEKDIIGHNTGNQIITQKDFNPCSPSGGQIIQTIVANNADCPLPDPPPYPCNIYNCSAPQYKCINGYCIAGTWCVISIVKVKNYWECSYGYSFPDGTNSGVIQIINSNTPCTPSCISTVEAKK